MNNDTNKQIRDKPKKRTAGEGEQLANEMENIGWVYLFLQILNLSVFKYVKWKNRYFKDIIYVTLKSSHSTTLWKITALEVNTSIYGIMALPFRARFINVKGHWITLPGPRDTYTREKRDIEWIVKVFAFAGFFIRKNIFACQLSVHNITSLPRHGQDV